MGIIINIIVLFDLYFKYNNSMRITLILQVNKRI